MDNLYIHELYSKKTKRIQSIDWNYSLGLIPSKPIVKFQFYYSLLSTEFSRS